MYRFKDIDADMIQGAETRCQGQLRSALVLGAGVVGMATAYALARRGVAVTVVESRDQPGCEASFCNGAQLSYAYTEALASPALLKHAPAVLLGMDPAIRMGSAIDPGYVGWLWQFLRNAAGARCTANTLAGLQLGLESRLAMHQLQQRHALEFGHQVTGKLHIYDNAAAFAAAQNMVARKRALGAEQEVLSPAEARRIERVLEQRRDRFVGAIYSPQEEVGDPHRFCLAMMDLLQREYGVTMRLGVRAAGIGSDGGAAWIMTDAGERIGADELVLCSGIGTRSFARELGLSTVLMPMKGYSLTAPAGPGPLRVSITDVARKVVFCPLDGAVRIAGLAELGVSNTRVDPRRLDSLKAAAIAALPGAADFDRAGHGWAGIRPMTASSLPQIRRIKPRIAVNIGHGMLGWTYSMGAGERLAAILLEKVA